MSPSRTETVFALLPLVSRIASDLDRAGAASNALLASGRTTAASAADQRTVVRFLNELDNVAATLRSYKAVRAEFATRMVARA